MSRIGRMPITVPANVTVAVDNNVVTVKGPKGELTQAMHPDMIIEVEGNTVLVKRPSEVKEHKSLHGLTRTLISNMIEGVEKGYKKELEVLGVGYRVAKEGKNLVMNLKSPLPTRSSSPASTSRLLASLLLKSVRRDPPSLIRARVSAMLVKLSVVKRARPAVRRNKGGAQHG